MPRRTLHRPAAARRPRRSWLARNGDWLPILVVLLPALHWSISPPKS
jgi:hypothetical protein